MPKFLITYHGVLDTPPTEEAREEMTSAFMKWASSVGDNMVDPGSPLAPSRIVTSTGDSLGDTEIGGYTIIQADNLDEAVDAVRSHPFLSRGGTLHVAEAIAP